MAVLARRSSELSVVDAVVAVALTLAAQVEIWAPDLMIGVDQAEGSRSVLSATSLLITLPVAWRRGAPLASAVVVLAASSVQAIVTVPTQGLSTLAATLLAGFSVAAYGNRREALAGAGAATVSVLTAAEDAADVGFALVVFGAAWGVGRVVQGRSARVAELVGRTRELERERREAAEREAAEERIRIAQELHDVVARRVSMMVVQAQALKPCSMPIPHRRGRRWAAIDGAGRQALGELRSLLGLLRGGTQTAEHEPQPDLSSVEELVEQTRAAGMPVELRCYGEPRPVPPAVALAAYRVVQEGLTNVVKHARSAPTRVTLWYAAEALKVDRRV